MENKEIKMHVLKSTLWLEWTFVLAQWCSGASLLNLGLENLHCVENQKIVVKNVIIFVVCLKFFLFLVCSSPEMILNSGLKKCIKKDSKNGALTLKDKPIQFWFTIKVYKYGHKLRFSLLSYELWPCFLCFHWSVPNFIKVMVYGVVHDIFNKYAGVSFAVSSGLLVPCVSSLLMCFLLHSWILLVFPLNTVLFLEGIWWCSEGDPGVLWVFFYSLVL